MASYEEIIAPRVIEVELEGWSKSDMPENCKDFYANNNGSISFVVDKEETKKEVLNRIKELVVYHNKRAEEFVFRCTSKLTTKNHPKWMETAERHKKYAVEYQCIVDRYIEENRDELP